MRVIFDISVLGAGQYKASSRTGIYRVVESLARQLLNHDALCAFSTTISLPLYLMTWQYLKKNKELLSIPLAKPDLNPLLLSYCHLFPGKDAVLRDPSLPNGVIARINGRALEMGEDPFSAGPLKPSLLKSADLYHSPFYLIPASLRAHPNLKRVLTIYDLIPVMFPHFFDGKMETFFREILSSIDPDTWITCISQSTKDDLCNYLPDLDPDKVFVTHLAASDFFYPCREIDTLSRIREKYGIPDGPYILSLCTLEPRKNISQVIRSFVQLVAQERLNDLSLVLVGTKGWDFDGIFNEIDKGGIGDRIIVTGYVPDADLAPLYSGAMMFAYVSHYEGFGLPPLEAMQCGVPVVTSNTSSLPEVVGTAGIMVAPDDTDTLCHEMLRLYRSEQVRQEMSHDSLLQARKFSWERCAEETIAVYRTALGG